MTFLKRQLPLWICFGFGLAFFLQYYIPHPVSQDALTQVNDWVLVAGGFAILLGIASLFHLHTTKIARQAPGWGYSLVTLLAVVTTLAVGLWWKGSDRDPDNNLTPQGWIYTYVFIPLNATMFATLGFYVVSAAFRTFRLKSIEAGVLMAAALLLILGRAPLVEHLWSSLWGYDLAKASQVPYSMNAVTEWVMGVPSMAGRRGILFGVTLGVVATSLKVILGIERSYLGGGDK